MTHQVRNLLEMMLYFILIKIDTFCRKNFWKLENSIGKVYDGHRAILLEVVAFNY